MTASIHPFDTVLGAEVRGIDLSRRRYLHRTTLEGVALA